MSPKGDNWLNLPVMIVIGIFAVLLTILALQGLMGNEWNEVGSAVTQCIVIIGVIGFAVAVIVSKK